MSWIVQDNPTPAATAIPTQAKRSNAKRKKATTSQPAQEDTTSSHNDTTEEKKELSKSQRKRARHQGALAVTEEEENWNKISLFNVPEMPKADPISIKAASKKKGKGNNAKADVATKKGGKKSTDLGQIVTADYGRIDDWGWAPVSTDGMLMEDMEGFLCLEELDGVHVDYEGTDETGKTVVFKHNPKAAASRKGKKVNHFEPLSVDDSEVFYDIDTFDEDVLMQQKQQEGEKDTDITMTEPDKEEETTSISEEGKQAKKKAVKEKKEKLKNATTPAAEEHKDSEMEESDLGDTQKSDVVGKTDGEEKKLTKKERQRIRAEEFKAKWAEAKAAKAALESEKEPKKPYDPMEGVDLGFDISEWHSYQFSPLIENALKKQKFTKPSPIQQQALPLGLSGRDVIGVAETGSGKTLAFGLPIIQHLAKQAELATETSTPLNESLEALILTPTRELAIQVKDHLVAFTQFTGHHVVSIVGGMSAQKQTRQLDRNPAIIVATPGRLWELISTNPTYSNRLIHARFLVLDEADRMLESGHFQELSNILKLLERKREKTSDWEQHLKSDESTEDGANEKGGDGTVVMKSIAKTDFEHNRQTFIFTATLSKELSLNLSKKKNSAKSADQTAEGSMEDLMERIEFHDESPAFVRVASNKIVASTLLEAKIDCLTTEKDLYLYYFVKKYPGRTLVFVNSIDAIRHLAPMMQLLGVEALGMHAQMQQRQRLKNLDRFKSNPHAIMIASDVAARGLDIPMVDHVIHYQVPRSGDIYVHRSGRTARAQNEGISLLICGPDEVQLYRKICVTLNKDNGIPEFPVDRSMISEMKKCVALAKKIDEQEHRIQKAAHQDDWMLKSAEAMDIILDEDVLNSGPKAKDKDDDNSAMTGRKNKIKAMRAELKALLQKRLMPQGASAKYITSGSIRDLADRLRDNTNHNPLMPAHVQSTALEDIKAHTGGKKGVKAQR
ncbi:ATP-dependent RNA helicase [Mortierella sp. AD011]|nr:ATP-dependent RNA helicase [Mortierella sp. AD010]KAF9382085.1 ATP-dependent RNA helicase [Mortierella sp. AD011]